MNLSGPTDTITYLDRATVRALLPDPVEQVDRLAEVCRSMAHGRAENPPKIGVHPRSDAFLHAMPAYLADGDVTALKWVAAYPGNPSRGLPYISGLLVLNHSASGLPVAVMEAAELTAARTAAASGVSIRHLAHSGWERVAILGYGEQGRAHAATVRALNPSASIRVYGGPRVTGPLPEVEVVPDARAAVAGADVVITAGPMRPDPARRLELSWLGERVLVVPVDFSAYVTAEVACAADDLVTDDVAQLEHYRGLGHFAGWPQPHRSLGEALEGPARGDLRVSCSLGVGAADAALADAVLRRATSEGLGISLPR